MPQVPALARLPEDQRAELEREGPVDRRTRLIPVASARAIVTGLSASLDERPSDRDAAILAAQLAGLYPQQPHDQETYLEGLRRTFLRYPRDLGERAVDEVSSESDYLPTRAALTRKLDALVAERRGAIRRAGEHLREHKRRSEEARETSLTLEELPADLRADVEELAGFARKGGRT